MVRDGSEKAAWILSHPKKHGKTAVKKRGGDYNMSNVFTKTRVVPLRELIDALSPERLSEIMSTFSCKKDGDVESFLKEKAIVQEKKNVSRTYLIFSINPTELMAYFTVAISNMDVSDLRCSKNIEQKMNINKGSAQCYLLGQLGKCDEAPKGIGKFAMDQAMDRIIAANLNVGCRLLRVDCKDALMNYYLENGFTIARRNKDDDLLQMIRIIGVLSP